MLAPRPAINILARTEQSKPPEASKLNNDDEHIVTDGKPLTLENVSTSLAQSEPSATTAQAIPPSPSTSSTPSTPVACVLRLVKGPNDWHEFSDYDQRMGQQGGLVWGEKKGRARNWYERWLTQVRKDNPAAITIVQSADSANSSQFGRTSGQDRDARRTWDHQWRRDGSCLQVTKCISQYDTLEGKADEELHTPLDQEPGTRLLERWYERSVIQLDQGTMTETKFGTDNRGPVERRWRQKSEYVTEPAGPADEEIEKDNDDDRRLYRLVSSNFSEIKGSQRRSARINYSVDKAEQHAESFEDEATGELWEEEWVEQSNGNKKGRKQGKNKHDENWFEEWEVTGESERKIKKWKQSSDGECAWGNSEDHYRAGDGVMESCVERWDKQRYRDIMDADGQRNAVWVCEEMADKTWSRNGGTSTWGEEHKLKGTYARDEDNSGEQYEQRPIQVVEARKKWYDNGCEKKTDKWAEARTFDSNHVLLKVAKDGEVEGDRYTEGHIWGETWGEVLEGATPKLKVRHIDRWWWEPSGNKWGLKFYEDCETDQRIDEKWYQNASGEKQVDRWVTGPSGQSSGVKFGDRWDPETETTVSWSEKWGKAEAIGEKWVEKSWSRAKDGTDVLKWGMVEGNRGPVKWFEKWTQDFENESVERYNDDGLGNFEVQKSKRTKRNGEVIDWFVDRHGECLGVGEKWAFKEGQDAHENRWTEKWNETRNYKTAMKTGQNPIGDSWQEQWHEDLSLDGSKSRTWASKTGKNAKGQTWYEEWIETENAKEARKSGTNAESEERWDEQWSEEKTAEGNGLRWTNKWAEKAGHRWGESWGEQWQGEAGRRWGESWDGNSEANKWSHYAPTFEILRKE